MQTNLINKPWFRSKKYLAFLTMEILLSGLAALALVKQPDLGWPLASFMTAIVLTMGAVGFAFNLTQAASDNYLRGMALSGSDKPRSMMEKLFRFGERPPEPDEDSGPITTGGTGGNDDNGS